MVLLAPLGLVGGLAAGHFAAPTPEVEVSDKATPSEVGEQIGENTLAGEPSRPEAKRPPTREGKAEYAKLDKHFVVPVIEDQTVDALVVVTMAIEVDDGATDLVYLHEPKLRDEFLSVLFNHGRSGAFKDGFSEPQNLEDLKASLNKAATHIIGKASRQVLLTSIIRQDM